MDITHIRSYSIGDASASAEMRADTKTFPRRRRRARLAKKLAPKTLPQARCFAVQTRRAGEPWRTHEPGSTLALSRRWKRVSTPMPGMSPGDEARMVIRVVEAPFGR